MHNKKNKKVTILQQHAEHKHIVAQIHFLLTLNTALVS